MAATRTQYRLVQAIPLIPAGLGFCASWFFHDTPRWLVSRDRSADGLEVLRRLRGPRAAAVLVQAEFQQIKDEVHATAQAREGMSTFTLAKELVTVPSYRERFLLALAIQLVAQWSGGNGITYYVPQVSYVR
jgi:hypothetical protein